MIVISVEGDGRSILVRDPATGAMERVVLDQANGPDKVLEFVLQDEDELSGRHQYCP